MTDDRMVGLASNWFEYVRRTRGSRAERKALELGEPAEVVRAAEQVREVIDKSGAPAVELIAVLLDHASDDEAVIAVAAGPLEDLLADHWDDVIDQIEVLARAGGPIRRALTSVYLSDERVSRLRPYME